MTFRATGTAVIGDLRSKLRRKDDEIVRVCEIPMEITTAGQAREILGAFHLAPLVDALYDKAGAVRMRHFAPQHLAFGIANVTLRLSLASGSGLAEITPVDLRKIRWTATEEHGLQITCSACATLTAEQLVKVWKLQPFVGLRVELVENQSALSLEVA